MLPIERLRRCCYFRWSLSAILVAILAASFGFPVAAPLINVAEAGSNGWIQDTLGGWPDAGGQSSTLAIDIISSDDGILYTNGGCTGNWPGTVPD